MEDESRKREAGRQKGSQNQTSRLKEQGAVIVDLVIIKQN